MTTTFPSAHTVEVAYPGYQDVHMCNVLADSGLAEYGLADSSSPFRCLPGSAWADGNLAELAGQLGKMVWYIEIRLN